METLISLLRLSLKLKPSKYEKARKMLAAGMNTNEIKRSLLKK